VRNNRFTETHKEFPKPHRARGVAVSRLETRPEGIPRTVQSSFFGVKRNDTVSIPVHFFKGSSPTRR